MESYLPLHTMEASPLAVDTKAKSIPVLHTSSSFPPRLTNLSTSGISLHLRQAPPPPPLAELASAQIVGVAKSAAKDFAVGSASITSQGYLLMTFVGYLRMRHPRHLHLVVPKRLILKVKYWLLSCTCVWFVFLIYKLN